MHRISSLAVDKRGATAIELIIKSNRPEEDATGVRLKSFLTRNPVTGLRFWQTDGHRTKRSIKIMQRPLCSLSRAYHRQHRATGTGGKLASSDRRKQRSRRRRRRRWSFVASIQFVALHPKTVVTNSFPSLPRFRIYSCYVALSSRNYVPRRLNSRQLLARSSLISLEIKDDNDGDGGDDELRRPPGETQYQRVERDTNLTISRGTKTISPWMRFLGGDYSNGTCRQPGRSDDGRVAFATTTSTVIAVSRPNRQLELPESRRRNV